MVLTLTKDNFNQEVLESDVPVLVDFWAQWCTPCHRMDPILKDLAQDVEGLAKVCKLEVDQESEIADLYEVLSIPTLIIFKGGKATDMLVGLKGKAVLRTALGV
jgi:thioredoxin 1